MRRSGTCRSKAPASDPRASVSRSNRATRRACRERRAVRAARGGQPDEEETLQPDGDRQARHAQRDPVLPAQQRRVEERQRYPEACGPEDRVELPRAAVAEVHDLPVDPLQGGNHVDAAVLDPVQEQVVDDRGLVVLGCGSRARAGRGRPRADRPRRGPGPASRAPAAPAAACSATSARREAGRRWPSAGTPARAAPRPPSSGGRWPRRRPGRIPSCRRRRRAPGRL